VPKLTERHKAAAIKYLGNQGISQPEALNLIDGFERTGCAGPELREVFRRCEAYERLLNGQDVKLPQIPRSQHYPLLTGQDHD
jgi:hypothetical protein